MDRALGAPLRPEGAAGCGRTVQCLTARVAPRAGRRGELGGHGATPAGAMTQLRTFVLIAVLALPPAAALRAQGNRWERRGPRPAATPPPAPAEAAAGPA